MVKVIIFDLWETLGTKNVAVSKLLREKFNIENSSDYMRKYEEAVQLHHWKTEEEMAINYLHKFGIEITKDNVRFVVDVFKEGIIKATLFDGIREFLIQLKKKGYKLGLLSNTTIFESTVLDLLNIKDLFDVVVFSWHKGNLKPSKDAFDHILKEFKVLPKDSVFIDDTEKNIVAAKSYGIEAIRFTTLSKLISDFEKLKLV